MNVAGGESAKTNTRLRILVVDDDRAVTQVLTRILEDGGFEAHWVNNPLKAIQAAEQIKPALIVIDFDMPQILGPELTYLLKRNGSGSRHVPVIFISGLTDDDHRAIAELSGAEAYLDKPINPGKLLETIHRLLHLGIGAAYPSGSQAFETGDAV